MLNYTTIPEQSFARGIDARSAENQIIAGFVRDLVNADIIEGRIRKRTGYASYAGNLPLRVINFKQTNSTDQLCLTFDGSIDLSTVPSCPILVYGKSSTVGTVTSSNTVIGNPLITLPGNYFTLSSAVSVVSSTVSNIPAGIYYIVNKSGNDVSISSSVGGPAINPTSVGIVTFAFGPFTTAGNTAKWYSSWTTTLRKVFTSSPSTGTIAALSDEHNIATTRMFVGLAESTSLTNLSSKDILWGDSGGLTPVELSVNKTSYDITAGYSNNSGSPVNTFLYYADKTAILTENWMEEWTVASSTSLATHTISAATHQLASYNIIYQLFKDDGTTWVRVKPGEFTVDSSTGEVNISVVNTTGSSVTYRVILSIAPSANSNDYNITSGPNTINVPDVISPFLFYNLYVVSGTTLTEVIPDSYTYDDVNKIWTLGFENNIGSAIIARVYYDYGSVRVNQLCVTDASITSDATDTVPQLTVYGIPHTVAYGNDKKVNRRGWVTHLDSYRSPDTTHMVAGLGGNLFAALPASEAPSAFAATMGTYYPNLNARLLSATNLGPVFWDTGSAPALTRGSITHDEGGTNWATVVSVAHQSNTGYTRYTLSTPNRVKTGNPITVNQDYLTVKGMSHSRHDGVFLIKQVDYSTNGIIVLDVQNDNISTSDYDDSATAGLGGIFTDSITTTASSPFQKGDALLSSFWGEETNLVVLSANGSKTVISDVYSYLELGAGLVVTGRRTSAIVPLRDILNNATVTNLVAGDTAYYSGFGRPLQVTSVDPVAKTATFDEVFAWEDSLSAPPSFTVAQRWVPAETPTRDSGDNLIPLTVTRHFANNDYGNQPFLRSAMVQNNMYLTNGDDEVYKYDGSSLYRAGIIPWQPGLFSLVETVTTGGISLAPGVANDGGSGNVLELVGGRIKIDKTQAAYFTNGDTVIIQDGTLSPVKNYTVTILGREEETSGNHFYFSFSEPLPFTTLGAGATVKMIKCYFARYSFRLNMKDANGVTTASAVTGAGDFVTQVAPTTPDQQRVHLRLVGLPAWDHYDYSNKNIELKIYRTLWSTTSIGETAVFFEVATKSMPYAGSDGYIDYIDTLSNDTLTVGDPVVGVLSPAKVPAAWDEPVRAKYVTSAGNRLVLANVVDWPTLAVTYLTAGKTEVADYAGQKFFFKRTPTDTGTNTDMVNRARYELINDGGVTVSSFASTTGGFTITVPSPGRAPVVGDWVYIYFAASTLHPLDFCGWWQIAAVSGTGPYTCTIKSTIPFVAPVHTHTALFASVAKDIPVNIGTDYNMSMANGDTVNFLAPANRILRRIGLAINATMRMVDQTISGYSSFIPWLTARSESDTGGQLVVKQPRADIVAPSVTLTNSTSIPIYINGSRVTNGNSVTALTTRYPSRLLVSYVNYPEIFDNPWAVDDSLSDSAIDVNSSDGQEITGVIPFFGESAFGAALQSGVLVVFKQNSIYLVDLSEKALGKNAVQRIETQGLGCTAPYSIAPTKDGIAFANDSGIYRLRRDQRLEYLGRFMERNWKEKVDRSYLDLVQGHHYGVGRQYKLSVPLLADSTASYGENAEVYVYNHTNETGDEPGGWARYTNHPATGWANLYQDAFFSTANGSVKRVRALGEEYDYRDDNDAIEVILETRAISFDQPGIRKVVSHAIINYRLGATSESTTVETAPDLFEQFDATTSFKLVAQPTPNGLSTAAGQDIVSIRHSLVRRRCIYITVLIKNGGINEPLEVAGITFVVAGLNSKGITQAATTKK